MNMQGHSLPEQQQLCVVMTRHVSVLQNRLARLSGQRTTVDCAEANRELKLEALKIQS